MARMLRNKPFAPSCRYGCCTSRRPSASARARDSREARREITSSVASR
jgi:hypothetical protein